ncbi:MAG: hypothetical protein R2837_09335 [Aliarcobacter sp.]
MEINPYYLKEKIKNMMMVIAKLNIPVISFNTLDGLINLFEQVINNYPTLEKLEFANLEEVILEINKKIELFNKLNNL